MNAAEARPDTLYCSFCGKSQHEVRKLVVAAAVAICDECTDLSHEIVHEADGNVRPFGRGNKQYRFDFLKIALAHVPPDEAVALAGKLHALVMGESAPPHERQVA